MENRSEESAERFQKAFDECMTEGRWMAACWYVKDGRMVFKRVVTCDFPAGDYACAIGHLGLNLHDMVRQEGTPEPLPQAKPKPLGSRPLPWQPKVVGQLPEKPAAKSVGKPTLGENGLETTEILALGEYDVEDV